MTQRVSNVMLNSGVEMPSIGLGVFQTPPYETRSAASAALDAGHRHIDAAAAYGNERQVGEAVHAAVFLDFELTAEELAAIDELDAGKRGGPQPDAITLESLGLEIPEA